MSESLERRLEILDAEVCQLKEAILDRLMVAYLALKRPRARSQATRLESDQAGRT